MMSSVAHETPVLRLVRDYCLPSDLTGIAAQLVSGGINDQVSYY